MDLTFSAEERAFEQEVRDYIASSLTPEMKRATALTPSVFSDPDIGMAWQRALHKKGWGAPGWPVEHGGPDWTPAQRWIFEAECARAGVPNVNVMGVKMVGPVIIRCGRGWSASAAGRSVRADAGHHECDWFGQCDAPAMAGPPCKNQARAEQATAAGQVATELWYLRAMKTRYSL